MNAFRWSRTMFISVKDSILAKFPDKPPQFNPEWPLIIVVNDLDRRGFGTGNMRLTEQINYIRPVDTVTDGIFWQTLLDLHRPGANFVPVFLDNAKRSSMSFVQPIKPFNVDSFA